MLANLLKRLLPFNGYLLKGERFDITQLQKQLVWGAIARNDH